MIPKFWGRTKTKTKTNEQRLARFKVFDCQGATWVLETVSGWNQRRFKRWPNPAVQRLTDNSDTAIRCSVVSQRRCPLIVKKKKKEPLATQILSGAIVRKLNSRTQDVLICGFLCVIFSHIHLSATTHVPGYTHTKHIHNVPQMKKKKSERLTAALQTKSPLRDHGYLGPTIRISPKHFVAAACIIPLLGRWSGDRLVQHTHEFYIFSRAGQMMIRR